MNATVLIIGPGAVRGPHPVPDALVGAAIDAIDDRHVLVEERPVTVSGLWTQIIAAATGDPPHRLLLVCPGWWSDTRMECLRRAAAPHCAHLVVSRRHEVWASSARCIIEIAPEFVLCRLAGSPVSATPRLGATAEVADAVTRGVLDTGPVLIDAPTGVPGVAEVAAALAGRLRGRDVQIVDDAALAAAVVTKRRAPPTPVSRTTMWAWAAGAAVAPAVLAVLVALPWGAPPAAHPTTLLTEGRVTVRVPAGWVARRITDGLGSPRVEVFAPGQDAAAILLTQSVGGPDLTTTAEMLAAALEVQPPGVFTELRTDENRGGRSVLGYTETRTDREIVWAVFLDGRVRIAIGCRQPATGVVIRPHCDEAIRSAHAAS